MHQQTVTRDNRQWPGHPMAGPVDRDLSVIIPVYNEEDNVDLLVGAITCALAPLPLSFEMIFVDDGSDDATFERLRRLAQSDARIRVIRFRRNHGQTPAMVAGIDYSKGRVLVTMDGDLQNDPADIPRMLEELERGFDVVVGWRHQRQDRKLSRIIPSKIANWLIAEVTKVPIRDSGCSLRAYRGELLRNVPLYAEMHRFVPAMMSLAGARISQIKVAHHARRFGKSKYGISRTFKVLIDLLIIRTLLNLTTNPSYLFNSAALVSFLLAGLTVAYSTIDYLTGPEGFSLIYVTVGLLLSALGLFMLLLGLLAQLIYKTGDVRIEELSQLTANVTDAGPPAASGRVI